MSLDHSIYDDLESEIRRYKDKDIQTRPNRYLIR